MEKKSSVILTAALAVGLTLLIVPSCRKAPRPLNIILMISDGCGYNCFEMADLYQYGRTGTQIYDSFPVRLAVSTHSASSTPYDPGKAWASFDFVLSDPTDSAAAATAMATGVKTNNDVVCLDPEGNRLSTILEVAEELGKKTGTVTSVPFCHATPASFLAHSPDRYAYDDIARQIIMESPADVVMGCGHPYYDRSGQPVEEPNFRYVADRETWEALVQGEAGADADGDSRPDPWTVIQTADAFRSLNEGPAPKRVFGMVPNIRTLQQEREGNALAEPFDVPFLEMVPTLAEMSLAALNVCDDDPDGFFLMIEGGAVDWAAEENQAGRLIEEQIFFNRAVEAVVDWIEAHSSWVDTLLIITSDHESGYITGPGSGKECPGDGITKTWKPLLNKGKGEVPGMEWHSDYHTNSLVPFFAKGYGSERFVALANETDPVRGYYLDNTEIGRLMIELLKERSTEGR
ncbi:MAG: alkaline phosphatase [Candidatus Aminicenantes bacterium]|nr:alkaline phosphatase [Candidatus Aminicenantes bacterium]